MGLVSEDEKSAPQRATSVTVGDLTDTMAGLDICQAKGMREPSENTEPDDSSLSSQSSADESITSPPPSHESLTDAMAEISLTADDAKVENEVSAKILELKKKSAGKVIREVKREPDEQGSDEDEENKDAFIDKGPPGFPLYSIDGYAAKSINLDDGNQRSGPGATMPQPQRNQALPIYAQDGQNYWTARTNFGPSPVYPTEVVNLVYHDTSVTSTANDQGLSFNSSGLERLGKQLDEDEWWLKEQNQVSSSHMVKSPAQVVPGEIGGSLAGSLPASPESALSPAATPGLPPSPPESQGAWSQQQSPAGSQAAWQLQQSPAGSQGDWQLQQSPAGSQGDWYQQQSPAGSQADWQLQQSPAGSQGDWQLQQSPRSETEERGIQDIFDAINIVEGEQGESPPITKENASIEEIKKYLKAATSDPFHGETGRVVREASSTTNTGAFLEQVAYKDTAAVDQRKIDISKIEMDLKACESISKPPCDKVGPKAKPVVTEATTTTTNVAMQPASCAAASLRLPCPAVFPPLIVSGVLLTHVTPPVTETSPSLPTQRNGFHRTRFQPIQPKIEPCDSSTPSRPVVNPLAVRIPDYQTILKTMKEKYNKELVDALSKINSIKDINKLFETDEDGDTPLNDYVHDGKVVYVWAILNRLERNQKQHRKLVDHQNHKGQTALYLACVKEKSNEVMVALMLRYNSDPNKMAMISTDKQIHRAPIHTLAYHGDNYISNLACLLSSDRVKLDLKSEGEGMTALHYAAAEHLMEMVEIVGNQRMARKKNCAKTLHTLIARRADLTLTDLRGNTALHHLASKQDVELMHSILETFPSKLAAQEVILKENRAGQSVIAVANDRLRGEWRDNMVGLLLQYCPQSLRNPRAFLSQHT